MIMTLLKQTTGMEDVIDLNIYSLMRLDGWARDKVRVECASGLRVCVNEIPLLIIIIISGAH